MATRASSKTAATGMTTILVAPLMEFVRPASRFYVLIGEPAFIPCDHDPMGLENCRRWSCFGMTFFWAPLVGHSHCLAAQKNAIPRRNTPRFVMELPSYKWAPSPGVVFNRVYDSGPGIRRPRRARLIMATNGSHLGATGYFPGDHRPGRGPGSANRDSARRTKTTTRRPCRNWRQLVRRAKSTPAAKLLEQSFLGGRFGKVDRAGRAIHSAGTGRHRRRCDRPRFRPGKSIVGTFGYDLQSGAAVFKEDDHSLTTGHPGCEVARWKAGV